MLKDSTYIESDCVRPPHPKGWGMLRAACPVLWNPEIAELSVARIPLDQNYRNLFLFPKESLLIKSEKI